MDPVNRDGRGSPTFDPFQVNGRFTMRQARNHRESPGGSSMTVDTSQTTATTETTDAAATTEAAATTTDETTTTEPTSFEWDGKSIDSLPESVQKIVRDARREAGDHRTAKNTAEQAAATAAKEAESALVDKLLTALGRKPDGGEAADPEKLVTELTTATDRNRQLEVELAVFKSATKNQGNPDALLDSRAFLAKVQNLDPTADDFQSKVDEAITAAVADNPTLKAVLAAGKGGVEITGGSGEGAITQDQFDKMSGSERNQLARRDPNLYNRLSGRA